jgi:recombination protein RecT
MKSKAKVVEDARNEWQRRYDALAAYLKDRANAFSGALPEKGANVDRFVQTVLYNVYRVPSLIDCTRGSLFMAAMGAAKLGLEPDQVLGHAYLVPFENRDRRPGAPEGATILEAQLIIGYRGMVALAWRDAKIMIRPGVVRARDVYTWRDGLRPILRHVPTDAEDPGPRVAAWAIADLEDGRRIPRWCFRREVLEAKASSRGSDNARSPWQMHEDSMWMKTPVRRLWPFLPVHPDTTRTLEIVEAGEPVPEAMEFSDALDGTPAHDPGATMARADGDLAKATDAMRRANGKALPEPRKGDTMADVLGEPNLRQPEKVAAPRGNPVRSPAEQKQIDATAEARRRFFDFVTELPASKWDEVFKRASVTPPASITEAWIEAQTFSTLNNLSEIASKILHG